MNKRKTLIAGTFLTGLGVALGAFGAHALKNFLIANSRQETFETAIKYQLIHGLALMIIGVMMKENTSASLKRISFLLLTGTVLFSGSLYVLVSSGTSPIAYVTPVGGLFMIIGWLLLLWHFIRSKN